MWSHLADKNPLPSTDVLASSPQVEINSQIWYVELAMTPADRYQGLSGRRSLAKDGGMLFVYPKPEVMTYCMRGCPIPLDIAFIDADMKIVRIHTMTVVDGLGDGPGYSSDAEAMYALEVSAGTFIQAGIEEGDRVILRNIPPAKQ